MCRVVIEMSVRLTAAQKSLLEQFQASMEGIRIASPKEEGFSKGLKNSLMI